LEDLQRNYLDVTKNNPDSTAYEKKFIESDNFPVSLVSLVSGKEKMIGGRPPYWEMVFWWTRKPLSSARAIIAGCILPETTNTKAFTDALILNEKLITHKYNPIIPSEWRPLFECKKLLDPFAGFGSIPLEALRLGVDTTSVELLPTAYVFLKSVLEYPGRYGAQLLLDIKKWGDWITEQLKKIKTSGIFMTTIFPLIFVVGRYCVPTVSD
jgi:putative DNA methylase